MTVKYIIKGKTYTLINILPCEESYIKLHAKVRNSKKEDFTLIKSFSKYTLYDANCKKVLTTTSIQEREV